MANVGELIKAPELKSSKFTGLPLGKTDRETGSRFLSTIVQYLLVNSYTGLMTELPDSVTYFFRQTPEHAALGKGYARTTVGHALSWPMPKIDIGEQYKHIKPPAIPVVEECFKNEFKLQCSTALETNAYMDKYINASVHSRVVALMADQAKSAINNTVNELYNMFWLTVGGNEYIFGNNETALFLKHAAQGAADTSQGLLKNYQEQLEPYFKKVKEESGKHKNIVYYDPSLYAYWTNKGDNKVSIKKCAKPTGINDSKTFIKKLYTSGGNTTDVVGSRSHSLLAMLSLIRQKISELTYDIPSYENSVKFDTSTAITENTELERTKCVASDLVVVLSHWDYDDLKRGVSMTGQTGNYSDSLDAATAGVGKVIKIKGLPPGYCWIGDKNFLNFIMVLDHSGSVFHWREEETQWYTNYYINFGVFTQNLAAVMIQPCGNFNPGGNFISQYASVLTEA